MDIHIPRWVIWTALVVVLLVIFFVMPTLLLGHSG
jgi:hypothetical protein